MTGFVAEEYADAFAPPTYSVGGRTHVGVLLSADQWFTIAPRIEKLRDGATAQSDLATLVRDMTDLCFPRPWWQVWRPRVSAHLARLPWGAQLEAVASFTVAQALAQNGRPGRTTTPTTNGLDSSA